MEKEEKWKRKVDCLWGRGGRGKWTVSGVEVEEEGGLPLGSKLEGRRSVSGVGGKRNDWKRNVG